MKQLFFIIFIIMLFSCEKRNTSSNPLFSSVKEIKQININEKTIKTRFSVPKGFLRVETNPNSFENYLQNFKLKPDNSKVHLYNGTLKSRQDVHAAILDIDVGKRNLQQCADAIMRLRAAFLYQQKRYNDIHFNFTNGFTVAYSKWRKGYRLKIKGNKVSWFKTNKISTTDASFKTYLQYIFMYAGTLSLEKELKKVTLQNLQIGTVFIQGGSPGHAIIVVDMAKNNKNESVFMLAQSYMPAQDIHILKNFNNRVYSPWYTSKNLDEFRTPEWTFSKDDLRRF